MAFERSLDKGYVRRSNAECGRKLLGDRKLFIASLSSFETKSYFPRLNLVMGLSIQLETPHSGPFIQPTGL